MLKFSIKNLTGNIQKLSTRRFLRYLNEASDVLNLVISSNFLLEALDNQSLALLAMETTIYDKLQVGTEPVFLGYIISFKPFDELAISRR